MNKVFCVLSKRCFDRFNQALRETSSTIQQFNCNYSQYDAYLKHFTFDSFHTRAHFLRHKQSHLDHYICMIMDASKHYIMSSYIP